MRKKIFHNWGLKIGSLVLAYLLWLLVIQFDDPPESKTFRGIPVTLTNTELLDQQGKVYNVLDNSNVVTVTVRAPGSIIRDLDASDIVAVADMSKLTEINTIGISFSVQNVDNVDNIRGNPDVLRLNVEDRNTEWRYVSYRIVGEVPEGYMVANVQLDQNRIEVSGPASDVSQISKVLLEIDVTGATSDVSANVETLLCDADDNVLDLPNVTRSVNNIRMKVEVLATKEVPVILNYMGTPADGYLLTGEVQCEPSSIMIAGLSSDLNNVDRIVIPAEELDITGATDSMTKSIDIRSILSGNNVRLADSNFNGRVSAIVFIEPIVERTLRIPPENIAILNVPGEITVEYAETDMPYQLLISGLEAAVTAVSVDLLGANVDLAAWMEEEGIEELEPGEYQIPVSFNLPEDVTAVSTVTLQIIVDDLEDM